MTRDSELIARLRHEATCFEQDGGGDPEVDAGTARLLREAASRLEAIGEPVGYLVKRATGDGTQWLYEFTRDRSAPRWADLAGEPDNCVPLAPSPTPSDHVAVPVGKMHDAVTRYVDALCRREHGMSAGFKCLEELCAALGRDPTGEMDARNHAAADQGETKP